MPTALQGLMIYAAHDNGIHECIFVEGSKASVDVLYGHIERNLQQMRPDDLALYLIDGSHIRRTPPIAYIFQRARDFERRYPVKPRSRFAIIFQASTFMSIIDVFVRNMHSFSCQDHQVSFFSESQRDEAVEWLLSQKG
jgi:hypothetical protein